MDSKIFLENSFFFQISFFLPCVLQFQTSVVGHNRPLTLPEPEPTLPFDLPLSEPTYRHRTDLAAILSPVFC